MEKINIFINHIYRKPKFARTFGFRNGIMNYVMKLLDIPAYKRFLKQLKKMPPDFNTLWEFADFIKLLELVFFYDNKISSKYYSSTKYDNNTNGFIINLTDPNIVIKFKLDRRHNEKIMLEVERRLGHSIKSTFYIIDRETNFENIHDINLIFNVNEILCREIPALLEEYYKKS